MNTRKLTPLAMILIMTTISCTNENNPLLADFNTPHQTPPFNQIKHEHFVPAIDSAIVLAKAEIDSILANRSKPSFENTIEALDRGGKRLSVISNILFNLNSAETDSTLQAIVREVAPKLTEFSNDINLNSKLFQKVKTVYENKDSLKLNPEQSTLLEKTYIGFIRNGANLDKTSKENYRVITKELSDLSLQFNENLLAETNAFQLNITNKDDLAGLPQSSIDAAAMTAKQKGMEGWVITLDAPSYLPFMKYSGKRELREKLFKAYNSRCFKGDQYDNQKIILRITELRLRKANLLGYSNYAKLVLEERMAETPEKVNSLLNHLLEASIPMAKQELLEVENFAKTLGFKGIIQKWDWMYYSEKLKNQKYSYNEEDLKPYFQLDKVKEGIFLLANKLYGIEIVQNTSISVYHPDVQAYDVIDENGKFLAVLYLDFFPREGKRGGAWMTSYRSQYKIDGEDTRPLISIVTNFTKPTQENPSLLTFNEFTTFLHEFGHALHGILADCTYSSLSGTSVYWDFVELPSQIMENWALEKDFLDLFAVHYKKGQKIPQDLVQKVISSKNFLVGYATIRQLSFGLLDMAWHSIDKPFEGNVSDFEKAATKTVDILPDVNGTNSGTAFAHIFAGGYAAGYYSYKWAEVLDADAFSVFKEKGIFNKEAASSFRVNILSKGGSEHPMFLYKRFRGQEPSIDALLIRNGMKK